MFPPKHIAIVHEWFTSMRGGEKCVEALCEIFPQAKLFTLLHVPGSVSPTIERMPITTSFIQHLPFAPSRYRHYLPLFPTAIQRFDLREFDLVISSHHCVAKGVRVHPEALHICYCHTPMRYIWDHYNEYFSSGRAGIFTRMGMQSVVGYLRKWDVKTASNPKFFIANSENVRQRIQRIYHRNADVIYPPVETSRFHPSPTNDGFLLVVSALVPYKRIDLAIEACKQTGRRLVIVGDGPEAERLKTFAGQQTEFLGWVSDEDIAKLYARCTAVLFPGEEDFGIVPLEAMASGKPVIAYGKGGALETVTDATGIFFQNQNVDSLVDAIKRMESMRFDPQLLHDRAAKFDREVYKKNMKAYILRRWEEFTTQSPQTYM
ncbi:MAG: glycosyltransferase [Bacteroidota bacterium]